MFDNYSNFNGPYEFLGTNLLKIASEKLGFLRKDLSLYYQNKRSVRQLIRKEVKNKQAILFEEGIDWKITKVLKNSFILNFCESNFEFEKPSLHGNHQIENVSCLGRYSSYKKFKLKMKNIKGIKETVWPGRMQNLNNGKLKKIIGRGFDLWLDGGHNIHASEILFTEIDKWKSSKIILILGMVSGKDQ